MHAWRVHSKLNLYAPLGRFTGKFHVNFDVIGSLKTMAALNGQLQAVHEPSAQS